MDPDKDNKLLPFKLEINQEKYINETNSDEKKISIDTPPDEMVEIIGCELRDTLADWSSVLKQCKKIEGDALGQLDHMLKEAYQLEVKCLKRRLEKVNKMIDTT